MFTVARDFTFSAAHSLPGLPEGHKCRRLHGHNYVVRVVVAGDLDARGFVVDYAELDPVGQWIVDTLDHRCLDDVIGQPSSAERVAEQVAVVARALESTWPVGTVIQAIGVQENPRSWVWWWSGAVPGQPVDTAGA